MPARTIGALRPGLRQVALAALLLPAAALGWGGDGHRAAAIITQERLCPAASLQVEALLGDMSIADAAIWPDTIRSTAEWAHTRDWHYINIDDDEPMEALVEGEPGHGRLLSAIRDNLALLADEAAAPQRRREALSFVLHLVADLHQPLHVGRREDRGGNTVTVSFEGSETNLHRLWDSGLVRSAGLRGEDYRRSLAPLVLLGAASWERGELEDWARESQQLRPWVYDFDQRRRVPVISKRYAETGRQVAALRLAQAGVRTAWLLNGLWCPAD
jgi:hypothetical protein